MNDRYETSADAVRRRYGLDRVLVPTQAAQGFWMWGMTCSRSPPILSPPFASAGWAASYWTKTVGRRAGTFDVVINGNYYGLGYYAGARARMGVADDPADTQIQGQIVNDGKVVAGDARPDRFYIAEVMNMMRRSKKDPLWHYEVGRGNPPVGRGVVTAVGNLGPLVDDGLRYGVGNRYRPPASGPATGDPGARLRPSLTQRNDNTFASVEQRDPRTGKTIIAFNPLANALFVGVEADHDADAKRPGVSYGRLVQLLHAAGFTEAVFCDGSDSAMLWHRGRMVVAPGEAKANTMTLAIGFVQMRTAPAAARPKRKR